jgi:hypothetical protein
MKWLATVLAVGVSVLLAACVEKETEKVDEGFVQANLLTTPPTPRHIVNADLGGKVVYLGCDLDKESAALGDRVKVTHYWKVVEAPGADWKLFTHVNGPGGDWINVDDTKMRKSYGPDRWKMGDVIRDEQVFPILKTWKSAEAVIYVGMYRRGGQSERDRIEIKAGPNDGHGRVRVATVKVTGGAATAAPAEPAPPYVVRRASGKIAIDGKADEPDWATAQSTGPFKVAQGGDDPGGSASAKLLWDDQNLYVLVEIADKDVASQYEKHDDPLWKEDAVELFIDADKNGHGYVELQVNPRNATFDSWFANVRPDGDEKWDSGMKTAVVVDGTLDQRDDEDRGWSAEIQIPLAAVKGRDDKMDVRIPPHVADSWKLDIVRVEKPKDKGGTASAWAQISVSDFHAPDKLVPVIFGDEKGRAEVGAEPAPAPGSVPAAKADDPGAKKDGARKDAAKKDARPPKAK